MARTSEVSFAYSRVFLFSLISILILIGGCKKQESSEIVIGAILPLTGDGAKYGEEARNAIELALSEPDSKSVSVIFEDDQGSVNGAIASFNRIVGSTNATAILGPMYSSTALALAPMADQRGVVLFSPSASNPDLSIGHSFFFRNWPSDLYEGGAMASFLIDSLGIDSVSIISLNLDYAIGLKNAFQKAFIASGGTIVSTEFYDQGAIDFRTQLSKIKSSPYKAIYLPGMYAEIGQLLKQARELRIEGPFFSCVGFDNPKVIEIASGAAEGVIFARPYYDPESTDLVVSNFVSQYAQRFGETPGVYAAHTYDAIRILIKVLKETGQDSERIREGLLRVRQYGGITGITSFDSNGDVVKPIMFMQVRNSKFVRYAIR